MFAPRARAASPASRTSTPAPSPMTKPAPRAAEGRGAVARGRRAARLARVPRLQDEYARALAHDEAVAAVVERTRDAARRDRAHTAERRARQRGQRRLRGPAGPPPRPAA